MASNPPDAELMRLMNFTPEDLAANRQGRLSLIQRGRLLLQVDPAFLILAVLLTVGIVVGPFGPVPIYQAAGLAVVLAILLLLNRPGVRLLLDALAGQVDAISGPLSVKIYQHDQRTFLGMMQQKFANGVIDDVTFVVPVGMAESHQGKPMQMYYTPRTRQAVSGEALNGK